jgi:hypothetical protein
MESLLTLSIGDYRAVDLTLRLTVALIAMTSALLLLGTAAVTRRERVPLIVAGVALAGAAWFESGVWTAWTRGFELAGTSYCVTGQLLAPEERIIAWTIGFPAVLFSFVLLAISFEKPAGKNLQLLITGLLLLAVATPFSKILEILLLGVLAYVLGFRMARSNPAQHHVRAALASMALGILLPFLAPLLPSDGGVSAGLVRGEIVRSVSDLLSLVFPGVILLAGTLQLLGCKRP